MKNNITIWREPETVTNYLDSVFGDFFGRTRESAMTWTPAVEVKDKKDHYLIEAELPGVEEKDLDVAVKNGMLIISAERKSEKNEEENGRSYSERAYGKFSRSFTLPEDVAAEKIEAQYKDGMLRITVPKPEEKKAPEMKVQIKR
ncbi:MAG: Hsp20/alpha crystallin family protein [Spirochaetes bacterium]|nr:Hsp20/alpha crystallin family protein [Spirochaetota bacterium]